MTKPNFSQLLGRVLKRGRRVDFLCAKRIKNQLLKQTLVSVVQFTGTISIEIAALVLTTVSIVSPAWAADGVLRATDPNSQINFRSAPDPNSNSLGYGVVGDRVEILEQAPGANGYLWYRVRFYSSNATGWIQGTFINVLGEPARPATPPISTLFSCQTPRNAVRVYRQGERTLMNIFSQQDSVTWLNGVPVQAVPNSEGINYVYRGEVSVEVFQAHDNTCSLQINSNPPEFGR